MRKKTSRNRKTEEQPAPAPDIKEPLIARMLDIPPTVAAGMPQIELSGNREAIVDGCQGILEYDDSVIKLTTGKMTIQFSGRGLQVKILTRDSAVVAGFITGVEFIT